MNILIVDDDSELLEQLSLSLKKKHYGVETAEDGEKALDKIFEIPYDLILLDIMLPRLDGLSVLKEIRAAELNTPVLMLTARGDVEDRVKGLDYGADDYLAKPFSMVELMARIRALLRRDGKRDPILKAGAIHLDSISRIVTWNTVPLNLTAKEFSILEFLLHNKGSVVSRFNMAEHVWGNDFDPFSMSNFVDVHIKNLRKKIKTHGDSSIIRTVRGIGFIIDE
ncbi:DNA-binding response regulator, OmpR family, contains REC and winged-helix (wHTH) domain [Desulfocicer vacuolatum DSM 3385]|uniref:DNA-binding response regulator, OmpR family, contains REC and winged-helix (WHTH) domain n=1 Tax=Desulfocicer vacuolatum DSM 3385 TaxID=1121400 RepID=A0A1W2DKR5_9BACT|nr:response regulator transcription factor [Desulfocicer vacuolatum]SMC98094.1 DNA-binding response regulator, OmpR family, contains REC and winged-helix (wHTH) domain [Desulfocicer vacuolatum DSM 3385]